ncbi:MULTISPECIES: hypothetical protein [Providencia]|uniref:hypothetical protein n=1 Tax=Providencia TaxID=586 RepID=UPI0023490764|nr:MULTISPECIES: hypothetical protein [unclassified Providencia]
MKSHSDFFELEDAIGALDVYTDTMGVTTYESHTDTFVNITFLKGSVVPLVDGNGKPVSSQVVPKRVASVTMSLDKAKKLHVLLGDNISKYEKQKKTESEKK